MRQRSIWGSGTVLSGLLLLLAWRLIADTVPAPEFDLSLSGDTLSLTSRDQPLSRILERLTHAGVRVLRDPAVDKRVTVRFRELAMQEALDILLQPFNYIVIWDVVRGPLGKMPRLAEIQVFREGRQDLMEEFAPRGANHTITFGLDGRSPPHVRDEVLLGLKPGTDVDAFTLLLAQIGGVLVGSAPGTGVYLIRLPPGTNVRDLLKQLARHPSVAVAEPNYVFKAPDPVCLDGVPPADERVDAADPVVFTGGVAVAVLDTGLAAGLDISAVTHRFDALDPTRPLTDTHGHGTQMVLIAAGLVRPLGAAAGQTGAPVIAIRVFDDNGYASALGLMRSLEFALAKGAKVLNLSWCSGTRSEFLENAIAYAQANGAIVVAAAGNEPTGEPVYPAGLPGVLGVAAVDAAGTRWEHSNYGAVVDLAAPGLAVVEGDYGHSSAGTYAGTSIASAYVSGALARYLGMHPGATADDALRATRKALSEAGPAGPDAAYGAGLLDAAALRRLLKEATE